MRDVSKILLRWLAVLLLAFEAGCASTNVPGPLGTGVVNGPTIAGGSPAAPPAPPAELPSALRLPESISIDVDTTRSSSGGSALKTSSQSALVGDGNFSDFIAFSSNLVYFANQRLDGLLGPLHAITIPVSPSLTKMETILLIGSKGYVARLNFGDFDLNGDGLMEGCSGHTAGLPFCVRVWLDDGTTEYKLLAARFDAFPTETNSGAGSLRGKDLSFSGPGAPIQVAANYDHVDPTDKFTDAFFTAMDEDTNPADPSIVFGIHTFASQLGPDASAVKTTNAVDESGQGLGRWREDDDYWSGSFDEFPNGSGEPTTNFTNECAYIPSGDEVTVDFCDARGISVGDLPFVAFPTETDVFFYDFPASAP